MKLGKGFLGKIKQNFVWFAFTKIFLGIIFLIFTSRAFPNAVFQDQDNFQDEVKFEDIDSNPQKEVRAHELILPIKSSSMLKNLFHFPFYVNYKRDSNPHVRHGQILNWFQKYLRASNFHLTFSSLKWLNTKNSWSCQKVNMSSPIKFYNLRTFYSKACRNSF